MTDLVHELLRARETRVPLKGFSDPLPASLADAYERQDEHAVRLLERVGGGRIGYKIGATAEAALAALGLPAPFHGPIFSAFTHASPARIARDDFFVAILETEIGFRFAKELPPRAEPYEAEEIAAAVLEIVPILEIADSRIADWRQADPRAIVTDLGYAGAIVTGTPVRDWRPLDLPGLAVSLLQNGERIAKGSGSMVLGDPFRCMAGFVNALTLAGRALEAGALVSSGTCTPPYPAASRGHFVADFGPLGIVDLTLN